MNVFYQIEKHDENGLVKRYKKRQSRSFLLQFTRILYGMFYYSSVYGGHTAKGIDGNQYSIGFDGGNFLSMLICSRGNGAWSSTQESSNMNYDSTQIGIVVGKGTTAISPDQYKMIDQIYNGQTTNTLSHSCESFTEVAVVGSTASFTTSRIFRNDSGSTVTITEMGIQCTSRCGENSTKYWCIIRDKLTSPIDVTNGQYIKITYTFQVTVTP